MPHHQANPSWGVYTFLTVTGEMFYVLCGPELFFSPNSALLFKQKLNKRSVATKSALSEIEQTDSGKSSEKKAEKKKARITEKERR